MQRCESPVLPLFRDEEETPIPPFPTGVEFTANYLSNFSDEKFHGQKSRKRLGNGGV